MGCNYKLQWTYQYPWAIIMIYIITLFLKYEPCVHLSPFKKYMDGCAAILAEV